MDNINTADLSLMYKYTNSFFDQIWKCLVTITVQTTAVPALFTTVPPHFSVRDHDNLTIKKCNGLILHLENTAKSPNICYSVVSCIFYVNVYN